ncbi:transposase [Desulfosarcina alkanivorans]|uniref:Transposase n=1 Tax=Desulfosarcina alkanivorans TaxID=571177 RepID=A0A5K7YJW5_9BACT|nr:transposase [Desulfosarcina alkanivorans]BBO67081.1 transposase [Desulfosarcina alkanivorans]
MIHSSIDPQTQADIRILGKIDDFFNRFKITSTLHRCGIRKRRGHSVRSLIMAIFTLPFVGKNFFRGIVINDELAFGKDAAYELLKGRTSNWRRLLLLLGTRLQRFFNRLTNESRESVLIVDDSPYDRSRSKMVELLSRVWDHSSGRFLKGFRMLTVCWSDGVSCLPMDFALLSSRDVKNRLCESYKSMDKRCCAWQRRKEATIKATDHLETMVKRILAAGIQAKYLLMDSWFTMPATVATLCDHIDVIGMVKKTPKIHYSYGGHQMDLMAIYRKLKKRRGRARIKASAIVTLKDGPDVKLVFVQDRRKKDWLALMSTDIELANEEIIRIYGKRWDIEVFFKMAKQHLKLAKEIQCRDFDALIAHTSIVFMRYMFLAYQCRMETDHRTFGDLFYACCDEMADISFIEALYRILTLAGERLRKIGSYCEKTASDIFDAIIESALQYVGLSKSDRVTASA